jgi:hypothetical protein
LAGSTRLKVSLQLDQSLAGVLQGTLVLLVLLFNGLRSRLLERASAETQDVLPTTPERGGSSSATTATTEAH